MKRDVAFNKLRILCERFERATPEQYELLPIRALLFGSLLTDKPEPTDIDLLVQFDESRLMTRLRQNETIDISGSLREFHRAVQAYCVGMKMIHIEILSDWTIEQWFKSHRMSPNEPHRLIWQAGLDWKAALEEIRLHPLSFDPQAELPRKQNKLRGEKRVQPIMQTIRKKLHVKKHAVADAVFEPIDIRRGFIVCVTSDACPPALAEIVKKHGYSGRLDETRMRKIVQIGRMYWIWGDDTDQNDIIGLGIVIFDRLCDQTTEAEAWIRQQINNVFDKAGVERLPVLEVK